MADKIEKEFHTVEYTIPLRALQRCPRTKRAPKAIKLVKEYVARHQKTDISNVWIDKDVNEFIWARGIENPPNKLTLMIGWYESEDQVDVYLPEE